MRYPLNYYVLTMAGFLSLAVFASYAQKKTAPDGQSEDINLPQIIKAVDLDKPYDFAGEALPMDNFDVRERLDRELTVNTYWHSNTVLTLKSTFKYFPTIERILTENGLPDDFKYLAVAESGLRNAVSPAGARGIWQFMENTGSAYGLEINSEVDERYHLEKATRAACKYLKDYRERFGSWTLAAAAYNMGGTKMSLELDRQRAKTFYDLNLNQETMRYVFRLVAIKEVLQNARDYGFYIEEKDGYDPLANYKTVEVSGEVENWGDFALEHGISYRMLKVYNPWLMSSRLTNPGGKTYQIRIPSSG